MFFGMNGFGPHRGCGENTPTKGGNDCTCLILLLLLLGGDMLGDNCECIWNIILLSLILNTCGCGNIGFGCNK